MCVSVQTYREAARRLTRRDCVRITHSPQDVELRGSCVALRPGSYDTLARMGVNNRISSVRTVDTQRHYADELPQPLPAPTYEYRRRPDERSYDARVTSARAVVGPPEHRVQMNSPPGDTFAVNREGEPRA